MDKVGTNDFLLDFPPYMQMYFVVNVENLKLYEPPMIMDQEEDVHVLFVDEFAPRYLDQLQKYIILDRRVLTS